MGTWFVVVPEATINLISNPSFEKATTGYSAVAGGTLARSTEKQRRGLYSGKYTPTNNTGDGIYYGLTLAAATTYTFSVDVWGVDSVPYKVYAYDVTGGVTLAAATFTGRGSWSRRKVTFTTGANTSIRLYLVKNSSSSTAAFYSDGWQCETKSYATTYCDGERDGCTWAAGAHTSTSSRSAQYYGGGQVVDLADYGFYMEEMTGAGMPPINNIATTPALGDGGIFQRALAKTRILTLVGMVIGSGYTLTGLHTQRQNLINRLKFDRLASQQPVQLRYIGELAKPLALDCYYDAGLEINGPLQGSERAAMRFMAYDPYFRAVVGTGGADSGDNGSTSGTGSTGDTAVSAAVQRSVTNANLIIQRDAAGNWQALGTGTGAGSVDAVKTAADGRLYVGGGFTTASGVTVNRVARWDPVASSWSALGTGMNGRVYALAEGPDGSIYAAGEFTTAGGVTVNYVAKWDGSAWSALGTGMNDFVYGLAFGPDGTLYATGKFSTAGGTAASRIAKWNGSAWSKVGATGLSGTGKCLAIGPDGSVFIGGDFTMADGVAMNYVTRWDGSGFNALGSGMSDQVYALAVDGANRLYAGGGFATAGGVTVNHVALWNGSVWSALGAGTNDSVLSLALDPGGKLWVGGIFTTAGGLVLSDCVAQWTGSSWAPVGVDLPNSSQVTAIEALSSGVVTLGYNQPGTAIVAAVS